LYRAGQSPTMLAMPLVNIYASAPAPDATKADELLKDVSRRVAKLLGKPERFVMTCLVPQTRMTFGGSGEPACYVEVKSVGQMSPKLTAEVSADLCARIGSALAVPADRIYVEFANAEGYLWGWNGSTFG